MPLSSMIEGPRGGGRIYYEWARPGVNNGRRRRKEWSQMRTWPSESKGHNQTNKSSDSPSLHSPYRSNFYSFIDLKHIEINMELVSWWFRVLDKGILLGN